MLNSNTSALVLLRLDTSPKRVALLTAPNPLCYLFVLIKAKKHYFVTSESTNSSNNTVIVTKCGAEPSDIIGDNYFLKQFHLFSDLCIMDVRVS